MKFRRELSMANPLKKIKNWLVRLNNMTIPMRDHYVYLEGIGPVDRSISLHIQKLNDNGYKTDASCSGLLSEHYDYNEYPYIYGYIRFTLWKPSNKYKKVVSAANALNLLSDKEFTTVTVYLPFYLINEEDDSLKMKLWDSILTELEIEFDKNE